jgi:hypothetical protein
MVFVKGLIWTQICKSIFKTLISFWYNNNIIAFLCRGFTFKTSILYVVYTCILNLVYVYRIY